MATQVMARIQIFKTKNVNFKVHNDVKIVKPGFFKEEREKLQV